MSPSESWAGAGTFPTCSAIPAEAALRGPVCGGKSLVPNVYGQPITRARETLRQVGWKPVKGPPPDDPRSREADLMKMGVSEVESCSGTGFGFCSYGYDRDGATLSVTTVGGADDPGVSGYFVDWRS